MGEKSLIKVSYKPAGRGQQIRTAWVREDKFDGLEDWLSERLKKSVKVEATKAADGFPALQAQPGERPGRDLSIENSSPPAPTINFHRAEMILIETPPGWGAGPDVKVGIAPADLSFLRKIP